jgi:rare lipoprotein A
MNNTKKNLNAVVIFLFACCLGAPAWAEPPGKAESASQPPAAKPVKKKPAPDHSGQPRKGQASYYHKKFHGRKMADGTPMNPNANIAASRTLPLGTTAEVTNLANGKSEIVEIRDRGPYIDGRIVDLSPKVAEKLDMKEDGVAPVVVTPIKIPLPDGSIKLGAGASSVEYSSGQ